MAHHKLPTNDGWTDIAYELGSDLEDNARISQILNVVCHVFRLHASGHWKSEDKERYAKLLMEEIRRRPSLVRRLLHTDDRVVKMVTHRAVELLKAEGETAL